VAIINDIPDEIGFLKPILQEIFAEINISNVISQVLAFTASIGKFSVTFIKDMVIILILYLFLNIYGKPILGYLESILPLSSSDMNEVFNKTSNVIGVVFYSILITATLEGFLFGVLVGGMGFNGFFFGVLFGFSSLIPIIGGFIVWVPVAIFEFTKGNHIEAIIISIYSIVMISIIADTFVKPFIIKYVSEKILKLQNSINEILIFFSIVAGISTFGFWGMIIGPAVTALFISVLKLNVKLQRD
jgi:predicted PurR-regulated permease PerM